MRRKEVSYVTTEPSDPLTAILPASLCTTTTGPGPVSETQLTTLFLLSFLNTLSFFTCCPSVCVKLPYKEWHVHLLVFQTGVRCRGECHPEPRLSTVTRLCLTRPSAKISPDMNTLSPQPDVNWDCIQLLTVQLVTPQPGRCWTSGVDADV